jgi:fibronectin-binding autotransporter adhesin
MAQSTTSRAIYDVVIRRDATDRRPHQSTWSAGRRKIRPTSHLVRNQQEEREMSVIVVDTIVGGAGKAGKGYSLTAKGAELFVDSTGGLLDIEAMSAPNAPENFSVYSSGADDVVTVEGFVSFSLAVGAVFMNGIGSSLTVGGQVQGLSLGAELEGANEAAEVQSNGLIQATSSTGVGLKITGASSVLADAGEIEGGQTGVETTGSGDVLKIAATGSVDGFGSSGFGVEIAGSSATSDSLINQGDIFGDNAVYVTGAGSDSIINEGAISGPTAIWLLDNTGGESIGNTGTIEGENGGFSVAIVSRGSSDGINIVNAGLIANNGANPAGGNDAVIRVDDASGTTTTIDNQGRIVGSGYAIQSDSDLLDIANSGTIHGGLYAVAAVSISNSGLWQTGVGARLSLNAANDSIDNSGTIHAALSLVSGGDALTNSGVLDGAITLSGSGVSNSIVNTATGSINGGISIAGGSATLTNSGKIDGAFNDAGTGSATNSGEMTGDVTSKGGLSNSGSIAGAVDVAQALTNTGVIAGDVTLNGPSIGSTMTNHGDIYGNVVLIGGSNTLVNTGVIRGDVTLDNPDDTVEIGPGQITGAIKAGVDSSFEFSGNFGNVTIDSYLGDGQGGLGYDTLQFAANDFGSFSAVQAAMTSTSIAGTSDTVIRLDANDSITLVGVAQSKLVAADFSFV